MKARFFQFYDMGLKRFISGSPKFLWSCCSQAGWGILHREKKYCTSIGSCQRILYSKILHCRLRGISMPLLTHVSYHHCRSSSSFSSNPLPKHSAKSYPSFFHLQYHYHHHCCYPRHHPLQSAKLYFQLLFILLLIIITQFTNGTLSLSRV